MGSAAEVQRSAFIRNDGCMKSLYSTLAVGLLLMSPGMCAAQARPATCEVRPLWVGRVRSANLGYIGRFRTDGNEGATIRSFKHEATGFVVTAGDPITVLDYSSTPQKPSEIRLAITVSDKEAKDIFESVNSVEASTRYGKRWNLSVTKNVNFEDVVYRFTLRCSGTFQRSELV